eukprot:CAMPEP_0115724520 /NCGR_PEP_ID=MMETSP0272-20121206/80822_1 /TAXON_ID=71861 /ORGANISM="Scrippsiella trochoidea, Strain CCMP3099" /LENGTH=136 /DNA_ID=CAMNT_0003167749 /DNA_START=45 /DNA_END=452 /DNA_ORIENTATION=+
MVQVWVETRDRIQRGDVKHRLACWHTSNKPVDVTLALTHLHAFRLLSHSVCGMDVDHEVTFAAKMPAESLPRLLNLVSGDAIRPCSDQGLTKDDVRFIGGQWHDFTLWHLESDRQWCFESNGRHGKLALRWSGERQ